jgi:hypothetical protein
VAAARFICGLRGLPSMRSAKGSTFVARRSTVPASSIASISSVIDIFAGPRMPRRIRSASDWER